MDKQDNKTRAVNLRTPVLFCAAGFAVAAYMVDRPALFWAAGCLASAVMLWSALMMYLSAVGKFTRFRPFVVLSVLLAVGVGVYMAGAFWKGAVLGLSGLALLFESGEAVRRVVLRFKDGDYDEKVDAVKSERQKLYMRVHKMDEKYSNLLDLVDDLNADLDDLDESLGDMKELADYMTSGQWKEDFEADEKGLIPKGINKGILAEDALYDLLGDVGELKERLEQAAKSIEAKLGGDSQ